jgi:hypothetical protein
MGMAVMFIGFAGKAFETEQDFTLQRPGSTWARMSDEANPLSHAQMVQECGARQELRRDPARGLTTILTAFLPQERQALHRPRSPLPLVRQLPKINHQHPTSPHPAGTLGSATTCSLASQERQAPERHLKGNFLMKRSLPQPGLRSWTSHAPAADPRKSSSS